MRHVVCFDRTTIRRRQLDSVTKELLQVFEASNFRRASVMRFGFLVLLEQIAPFVSAHGGRPIVASLFHFLRDLLPQMLVAFGGVEESVHFFPESYERFDLVLDPCLCPLFGRAGCFTECFRKEKLMWRAHLWRRKLVNTTIVSLG